MVGDEMRKLPDFPPQLRTLVEHMILSHHGQLEFGSPKLPLFPEALLLHYIDDLDSKMECMRALIEGDRQIEGCFTGYSTALERTALKKARYLDGSGEIRPQRTASAAAPLRAGAAAAEAPAPGASVKSDSPFADKLKQALAPAEPRQE